MAKFIVTLAVLCVFGAVLVKGFDKNAAIAEFMAKAEVCKTEVGAKEADISDLVAKQPATSAEGKCLRSCLMKKYEVMDTNGKFVKEVAMKHAETYTDGAADKLILASEILDACVGVNVPDDHCEAAEVYGKCFKEQAAGHGLSDFEI